MSHTETLAREGSRVHDACERTRALLDELRSDLEAQRIQREILALRERYARAHLVEPRA